MDTDTSQPERLNIDLVAEALADFVASAEPRIEGPHEIAYGFGWNPSISYWIGQRRVHLYPAYELEDEPFVLEAAHVSDEFHRPPWRCHVTDVEQIRDVMERFLCWGIEPDALDEYEWIRDGLGQDINIPDPPHSENAANLGNLVGEHFVPGGPSEDRPVAKIARKPWWKLW